MGENYNNSSKSNDLNWIVFMVLSFITIFFFITIPTLISSLVNKIFLKIKNKKAKIILFIAYSSITIILSIVSTYFIATMNYQGTKNWNWLIAIAWSSSYFLLISWVVFFVFSDHFIKTEKKELEQWKQKRQKLLQKGFNDEIDDDIFKPKKYSKFIENLFALKLLREKAEQIVDEIVIKKDPKKLYLNNNVCIDDASLEKHTLIYGTTGTGKTNTILHFLKYAFNHNDKLIFVDGKADMDLITLINSFCKSQNKKLAVVSIEDIKQHTRFQYNPFHKKTIAETISMLVEMEGFSDSLSKNDGSSHYKRMEKTLLEVVVQTIMNSNISIDFATITNYLDKNKLVELVKKNRETLFGLKEKNREIEANEKEIKFFTALNNIDKDTWSVLKQKFYAYAQISSISKKGISLHEIMKRNKYSDILLFSLNTMSDPTSSKLLGNLIMHDIKQCANYNQEQCEDENRNHIGSTYLIFDEIGSYASSTLLDLLTQGRSKKYRIVLAVQGASQLQAVSTYFNETITNNTNNKIVHRFNEDSVELVSKQFGTSKEFAITKMIETNAGQHKFSKAGTVRETREFKIHPDEIKSLGMGEAIMQTLKNGRPFLYKTFKVDLIKTKENLISENDDEKNKNFCNNFLNETNENNVLLKVYNQTKHINEYSFKAHTDTKQENLINTSQKEITQFSQNSPSKNNLKNTIKNGKKISEKSNENNDSDTLHNNNNNTNNEKQISKIEKITSNNKEKKQLNSLSKKENVNNKTLICKKCNGVMIEKTTNKDNIKFFGCENFPKCKHTEPIEKPKKLNERCIKCGNELVIKLSNSTKKEYVGCINGECMYSLTIDDYNNLTKKNNLVVIQKPDGTNKEPKTERLDIVIDFLEPNEIKEKVSNQNYIPSDELKAKYMKPKFMKGKWIEILNKDFDDKKLKALITDPDYRNIFENSKKIELMLLNYEISPNDILMMKWIIEKPFKNIAKDGLKPSKKITLEDAEWLNIKYKQLAYELQRIINIHNKTYQKRR